MIEDFSEEQLRELESQLSFPDGQKGIEMALLMNESNIGMTLTTIESLEIGDGDRILELGHGNCSHLADLLKSANDLSYTGLEISPTKQAEAANMNRHLLSGLSIQFKLYDGLRFPFQEEQFDRIFTVNTIYFWKDPLQLLNEMSRALSADGLIAIAFAHKEFMKKLPFVKSKFTLYDNADFRALANQSELKVKEIINHSETVTSKTFESVQRDFSIALLSKGNKIRN